jgi:hypothetical protein
MSQFRIKNIDHALPDEWVYKINDGVSIVGDDIDARDPNELADAILDTQTIILKASVLPAGAILKPASGLAERITILEGIAGDSTLQDIYNNGNLISVVAGRPLTFGTREEFNLDDAGNLSFKPVTMKVRGLGFSTLDFTNLSVTTNLGDLLVGATSPGSKLTLRAEDYLYFKDVFLNNPVTLSEPGNTALSTMSQSLVGAINELKASSFDTSFGSVYAQSNPPILYTDQIKGAVVISEPLLSPANYAADILKVAGVLNVTKTAKVRDLKIGSGPNYTTIADTAGYVSSYPIKTTNYLETPTISSGTSDLTITDKRVSFPFSDTTVSDLATTRKSVIGAINELKSDITTVGNQTSLFANQHETLGLNAGDHKAVNIKAQTGNNALKFITIKNSNGTDKFTVSGNGDIEAASASIAGLSVVSLLTQLSSHLANDGTAHSAFASHISATNPHGTVESIQTKTGPISLASSGSINITTSGNTINFDLIDTFVTLQNAYSNLSLSKELTLTSAGLTFKDSTAVTIMTLQAANVAMNKNLLFTGTTPSVQGSSTLKVEGNLETTLSSATENVIIQTTDANKKVIIQGVHFNEAGAQTLSTAVGASVLGAFKKINDNIETEALNGLQHPITSSYPFYIDSSGLAWPHIPDFHPANEFISGVDFFWANNSKFYYPQESIASGATGKFYSSGTHILAATSAASLDLNFHKGGRLFPALLSYNDIAISSVNSTVDGGLFTIDNDFSVIGRTGLITAPNASNAEFKIEQAATGVAEIRADKTRDNIIALINSPVFRAISGYTFSLKAGIWGQASKAYLKIINAITAAQTVIINSSAVTGEGASITLTASATPTGFLEFLASTDTAAVATSLADAINRTTFRTSTSVIGGHKIRAKAIGSTVVLEWYKPGQSGNLPTVSGTATSLNMSLLPFAGGTTVLRIYNLNVSSDITLNFGITNLSGFVASTIFTAKEKASDYFLTAAEAKASSRYAPNYVARELGTIEDKSGNIILFKIKD